MPKPAKPPRQGPTFKEWFRLDVHKKDPTIEQGREMDEAYKRISAAKNAGELREEWRKSAKLYNSILPYEMIRPMADYVFTQARFKGDEHVLSFGSGTGIFESFIAQHKVPNGTVIGVDFAHEMNVEAKKLAEKSGAKNLFLVTADAEKIRIKSDSQNIVLAMSAQGINNQIIVEESKRILVKSPDSKLIIQIALYPKGVNMLKQLLTRNGFEISNIKEFHGQGEIIVFLTAKFHHNQLPR